MRRILEKAKNRLELECPDHVHLPRITDARIKVVNEALNKAAISRGYQSNMDFKSADRKAFDGMLDRLTKVSTKRIQTGLENKKQKSFSS